MVAVVACSSSSPRALLVVPRDAGADSSVGAGRDASSDAAPDADPTLGGPCLDDGQCDDMIACTYDSCDRTLGRCRNVPDSSQCQDGSYCDGQEVCVPAHGCEPGPAVSCDNGNGCQTATCVEALQSCVFQLRDVDRDGDPDARCEAHRDCDDLNPEVSSLHAEICANGVDDNCNGVVDEVPCVVPKGGSCSDASTLSGSGSLQVSTVGVGDVFPTSCSVTHPASAQTVVVAITIPPGPHVNLDAWVSASSEVAVALQSACGYETSELACGSAPGATSARARAYDLTPGTYFAIVTTQNPTPTAQLQVTLFDATAPPANVDCAHATPIMAGSPMAVAVTEPLPPRLPSGCPATTGQLTYALTLTRPQDVRVYASASRGSGNPVVGFRGPHCADAVDELACQSNSSDALYEQDLPPGTYIITVAGTAPIDATLDVELSAPTPPTSDETCAAPPALASGVLATFDLGNHGSAIRDGCFAGGPDLAYDLRLGTASDVLLVEQLPQSESGGLSLDAIDCSPTTRLGCTTAHTPLRLGRRNVRAGDFRVVVADQLGLAGSVEAFVRPTVAPTILPAGGAMTCAQAVDASSGGFFTGDTSTVAPGYSSGCDAPTQAGERFQLLSLTLPQAQRVVLDMEGSSYQTLLDVRQGPTCPGTPVGNGCYVAFDAQRSFLDLELGAGSYWVLVGGYDGAAGPWQLDVRVLPP